LPKIISEERSGPDQGQGLRGQIPGRIRSRLPDRRGVRARGAQYRGVWVGAGV